MAQDKTQAPPAPAGDPLPPRLRPERAPLLFLKGALMGTADVVPGVSGGTVALLVGVYERLIAGLNALFSLPVRLVQAGPLAARRRLAVVPFQFLFILGAGMASALFVGARLLPGLIERHPALSAALFFGLILGSIPVAWRRIGAPRTREYALAALAAVTAFLLVGIPPRAIVDPAWWIISLGAMVAITALVLPGVSGSYLLLVLGLYTATLTAIATLDLAYLLPFALGALAGAIFIVRLLGFLLKHWHRATLAVLVGLMIGALRATWPWLDAERGLQPPPADLLLVLGPIALFLIGFLLVRGVDLWVQRNLGPQPLPERD